MKGRAAFKWASARLASEGRQDSDRIALLLLKAATDLDGMAFIDALDLQLSDLKLAAFKEMVNRAVNGEPVQYILGNWDFFGLTLNTDRRALIPRPETELLVEAVLQALPPATAARVFDAGCGTGCIGIALKLKRPAASVTLCDISAGALTLAVENAGRAGADVAFVQADMRRILPGGPYDIIVSNPPYISTKDMETLSPVISKHEPVLALHGGEDGMDFIRALADRAQDSLAPGGRLFIEVGYDQAERTLALLSAVRMDARAIPDYSGKLRIIAAGKGA